MYIRGDTSNVMSGFIGQEGVKRLLDREHRKRSKNKLVRNKTNRINSYMCRRKEGNGGVGACEFAPKGNEGAARA